MTAEEPTIESETTMRKTKALFGLALGCVVLALGAVSASAGVSRSKDVVTLNATLVNTVQNAWEQTIQTFEEKYPNIHINATYLDSTSLATLIGTQLQAGNAPDIFTGGPGVGPTGIATLAPEGKLLDLSDAKWVKRIPASGIAGFTWNNKVWGWPNALGTNGVFYNVDVFKQLKLKPPTNLSDVFALCKKINAAGKVPIALGIAGSLVGIQVMALQLEQQFVFGRDPNWVSERIANKVTFSSSPLWRAMFQTIVNLNKDGCFEPNPVGTSYPNGAASLVASGQAAMEFLSGGTVASVTSVNPNINYKMFELPPDNSGGKHTVASVGWSLSTVANGATKHPAEVKTFFNYIADPDVDYTWAKLAGSIAPLDASKGIFPDYLKDADAPLAKAGRLLINPSWQIPSTAFTNAWTNDIVGLFTGQQTVTSALADLDKSWSN